MDGTKDELTEFGQRLMTQAPPLSKIDEIKSILSVANGFSSFEILHSETILKAFQPISPDVCICDDCLRELFTPGDRRYLYPFINCTNCGPRFTIIQDIPYDRPFTTMSAFKMCPDCEQEYQDPEDRRFHAQPVACPVCGPHIWLENHLGERIVNSVGVIPTVQKLLNDGNTIAIKGLGGFHLACDALNDDAVHRLRNRKMRVEKPFAVMVKDTRNLGDFCSHNPEETAILESRQRPIVILNRSIASPISALVAPGQETLGVLLPYTPLHYLFFSQIAEAKSTMTPSKALVMTSGNISEEPIAFDNQEARERLSAIADYFLMNNRPIHVRCDDLVVRVSFSTSKDKSLTHQIWRSRGFAPTPIALPWDSQPLLACGAELKNTFCLANGPYAFLSHHIGDLENYETLHSFEEGIHHFEKLFKVSPGLVVHDLHPNYLSSRYAQQRAEKAGLPLLPVQHHHAHIAACMVDNSIEQDQPVIGVALDGTGYGTDGAIWGGEFLIAGYSSFHRAAHLKYVPLVGGDQAIREPWRMALSWLEDSSLQWSHELMPVVIAKSKDVDQSMFKKWFTHNALSVPTSSMGRLFDAAASLAGIRQVVNYEAQAAIEFEAALDPAYQGTIAFDWNSDHHTDLPIVIDPHPLIAAFVEGIHTQTPVSILSAMFHNSVAQMVLDICQNLSRRYGISDVVLSGGVWQNMHLFEMVVHGLYRCGLRAITHQQIPANDGGISVGQAAVGNWYKK